jgi:putative membrane protein
MLHVLCTLFLLVAFSTLLRSPDRFNWMLENLMVLAWIGMFSFCYHRLTLSGLSYLLLFAYLCVHEFGAQYSYAKVPLGEWMKPLLHTSRNDYDRLAHFLFGLLTSYLVRDVLIRSIGVRGRWVYRLSVLIIASFAAIYEMFEAWVAVLASDDLGSNSYLGWQNDPWDSQKDMFVTTLGAGLTMGAIFLRDHFRPYWHAKLRQRLAPVRIQS